MCLHTVIFQHHVIKDKLDPVIWFQMIQSCSIIWFQVAIILRGVFNKFLILRGVFNKFPDFLYRHLKLP